MPITLYEARLSRVENARPSRRSGSVRTLRSWLVWLDRVSGAACVACVLRVRIACTLCIARVRVACISRKVSGAGA